MEGIRTGVSPVDLSLPLPDQWTEVGQVDKIFIYPLKSARGHLVKSAQVTKHGLRHDGLQDRQFMIVDAWSKKFLTARQFPKLVLVQVDVKDNSEITFSGPEVESVKVQIPKDRIGEKVRTQIFGKSCRGYLLGEDADNWITGYIRHHHGDVDWSGKEHKMQVIFHPFDKETQVPDREKQHLDNDPLVPFSRPEDVALYADEYPVNLQTISSLEDVNKRLESRQVKMNIGERQFRPNILASGNFDPFAEDSWTYIRINDTIFRNARLCARCIFTTINPETGEKDQHGEPLKTLKSYRSSLDPRERKAIGDSPLYGIHLGVDQCGTVHTGDKIFVGVVPSNWKSTKTRNSNLLFKIYLGAFAFVASTMIANLIQSRIGD